MPLPPTTRYVVLEWDSPGSPAPELAVDDLFTSLVDAHDLAVDMGRDAKAKDQPTTYTVHAVDMDVIPR